MPSGAARAGQPSGSGTGPPPDRGPAVADRSHAGADPSALGRGFGGQGARALAAGGKAGAELGTLGRIDIQSSDLA